jgi:Tol biopolymer transport system component
MKTGLRAVLALLSFSQLLPAQRDPVLKQIDVPHRYYYREMYLPQLTTGPSAPAWTPDSQALLYSMAGSLWRQNLDSTVAEQLTAGAGYDYQPDCSPDGRWVVYSSYLKDAIELWALDLRSRRAVQLTSGGAVNVDPRFSPDGKYIAFVSTSFHGHFHIFRGEFSGGELKNVQRLTEENRSSLPRFYYSQIDHEISPAWSPDGSELLFISNRAHIYGTGGFWRMKAQPGAQPREIHYEETTWKARPDFSPDGKRIVYASYLGGQWHQLWVMPSEGGYAFPVSYGGFDNTNPRWSPDGKRIAFISNRTGNTSLWILMVQGGAQTELVVKQRHYLKPMAELTVTVVDASGHPTPARIFLNAEDGRAYAPDGARVYAEDNFVRSEQPFESHYFHSGGEATVAVAPGRVEVEVTKGLEYRVEKRSVQLAPGQHATLTIALDPLSIPAEGNSRWLSADLHVHMNYGGVYWNQPANLVAAMAAENLPIVEDLIVNKEQRIPDIAYFRTTPDPASTPSNVLLYGQEFHTSYWGHLGLLHLAGHVLLPGYATYPYTAAASMFPTNANIADMAHAQEALVGYVHPFDWPPDPYTDPTLTHGEPADVALELPVDVALGKVDYIEAVGFSDHKSTAEIWYRLLNCGFHLPSGAGSDAMANFASLRGPVGLNRVYAAVPPGPLDTNLWLRSLKQGHTFATNGPLLGFALGGRQLGDEIKLPAGEKKLEFTAWLRSLVPVDHLQVVCNGQVARDLALGGQHEAASLHDTISVSRSGWCLLRAYSDKSEHPVLDIYPYATTSPIYIAVEGSKPRASEDARFFLTWIDRLTRAVEANQDWNTQAEEQQVLDQLSQARKIYEALQ